MPTAFFEWGDLQPDLGGFGNRGLFDCRNVIPISGSYLTAPQWKSLGGSWGASGALGLHVHSISADDYRLHSGDATKLYEANPTNHTNVDKTRLVGGAYTTGADGWFFASFGANNVIAANYADAVQLQPSTGAPYQNMITTAAFAPKFKFPFSIRGNLFGAYCDVPVLYDGLSAGAHPNLVAWSRSDDVTQFGSFNANPEIIGAGYQEIFNDLGVITGGIGVEKFGIVAQQRGFTRIDGPPYSFDTIVRGYGCRYPRSLCALDGDVYFWGNGPCMLPGGQGPIVQLAGTTGLLRYLMDNRFDDENTAAINTAVEVSHVSASVDHRTRSVWFSYTSMLREIGGLATQVADLTIVYNVDERRFSFIDNNALFPQNTGLTGALYLCSRPAVNGVWIPGADVCAILREIDLDGTVSDLHSRPAMATGIEVGLSPPYLEKSFHQLDSDRMTRITKIRPIYRLRSTTVDGLGVSIQIKTKNRPYEELWTGSFAELDNHGAITTPSTVFGNFHSWKVVFDSGGSGFLSSDVVEYHGCEVEWQLGGRYAA